MHILIVDDDTKIRDLLKKYLNKQGYQASAVESAEAADKLLKSMDFDVMILDVMMGGKDGISFARELRKTSNMPIIMLTARGSVDDRLMGLEAGVDDFIPKPFDPRELVLRIEAVMRRVVVSDVSVSVQKFGQFIYELNEGRLTHSGENVDLTRSERDIMNVLVQNFGQDVERDALTRAAHLDGEGSRAVDVQMTRLRKKIEQNPKEPMHLQTVRGVGYKLVNGS